MPKSAADTPNSRVSIGTTAVRTSFRPSRPSLKAGCRATGDPGVSSSARCNSLSCSAASRFNKSCVWPRGPEVPQSSPKVYPPWPGALFGLIKRQPAASFDIPPNLELVARLHGEEKRPKKSD